MRYWLAQLQQTVLNMQVYTGTDSNGSIEAHKDSACNSVDRDASTSDSQRASKKLPGGNCGEAPANGWAAPEEAKDCMASGATPMRRNCFLSNLRFFFSSGPQRWQNSQLTPLSQPFVKKKAQGLQVPTPCPAEPLVGIASEPTLGSAKASLKRNTKESAGRGATGGAGTGGAGFVAIRTGQSSTTGGGVGVPTGGIVSRHTGW